ncbi:MAG: hypothetical protein DMF68_14570 [Acidobacteria bacterium]|nr:MAG: hypothetical protein DMF68_14570 [Acidobacteriota bacterium]
MKKLNTCEECGHYDWVHESSKCTLDYCGCGKPQSAIDPTIEDDQKKPDSKCKEEMLPQEA